MPLTVSFELSDRDLENLSRTAAKARKSAENGSLEQDKIIEDARGMLDKMNRETTLPDFVASRVGSMRTLLDMLEDEEWALPDQSRYSILGALAYFTNPDDIIPDSTPGLGFIDDAIMFELVVREMDPELESYADFCQYRATWPQHKGGTGKPYSDWIADKRANLHHRITERRNEWNDSENLNFYHTDLW